MTVNRRTFLSRSAVLGAGGLAAAAGGHVLSPAGAAPATGDPAVSALDVKSPFAGAHQAGIVTPQRAQVTYAALDVIAPDASRLAQGLNLLSARARGLSQGTVVGLQEVDDPPADSGTLGPTIAPDGLAVTIAFGASLFDDRYGLAKQRPAGLVTMPNFPNDDLDATRSHGDVLLQIEANNRDTVVHTLRELMRLSRDVFSLRWTLDGFQSADRGPTPKSSRRNLFGFRDGTSNPDVGSAVDMDKLVWVDGAAPEPAWTNGGTYQVVRAIRMHVEFWDRVGLREQENMIGRYRADGAPIGGDDEFQNPRYDLDPKGTRIPMDAHIRLANPRDASTADQRILRRGYNYHRGFDEAGQLDQGLIFVAYNRDIAKQFTRVQNRLADEPMVDYITPVGGGYFFAPAGASSATDWVGSGLFTA